MSINNKISLKKLSMRNKISSELIKPDIQILQNRISLKKPFKKILNIFNLNNFHSIIKKLLINKINDYTFNL